MNNLTTLQQMYEKEMIESLKKGLRVFWLDTDSHGGDEPIFAESDEEALQIVIDYYEINQLPENWEIKELFD